MTPTTEPTFNIDSPPVDLTFDLDSAPADLAFESDSLESIDDHLDRYIPNLPYAGQWARLRPEIMALVRKTAPTTLDELRALLSALGNLIEGEIDANLQALLPELLTDRTINRTVARLNQTRGSRKRIQGVRAQLIRLHRELHELPPVISGPRQLRKASDPITVAEVDEILNYLKSPRKPMDLHVTRRFILALGAGLTGLKADAAHITFNQHGIEAIFDGKNKQRPLSKMWISRLNAVAIPKLEDYRRPTSQALAAWLRDESLAYIWPRLRDEWLLEQVDGSQPAFIQMRRAQITEYDSNRLLLRWNLQPVALPHSSLRDRNIFLPDECELEHPLHHSYQSLNKEGLDKESGNAMNASTRGKISKAQVRRLNAEHASTLTAAPAAIPEAHRGILARYVCKSAREDDLERVNVAFISVMERTAEIKSRSFFLKNCSDVANLASWAASMDRDLSWSALMSHELIHDYIRSLGTEAKTAHYSQRLRRLKSLASHLNPGVSAPPKVDPVGHKAVSDPYTSIEMAAIIRVARSQQSESITRQLAFILGACRGAGAGVSELRALRGKHVEDRGDEGIFITLGLGEAERTIPIRREWETHMRRGITGLSPEDLAIGAVRNRRNIAGEIIERTVALGDTCPRIEAGRLRTTWIAELMSEAIPVQVILNAAGLRGARTLTDLARRFSQEEINDCLGTLRGVA